MRYFLILHKGDFVLCREEFPASQIESLNEVMVQFNSHADKVYRLRIDIELKK